MTWLHYLSDLLVSLTYVAVRCITYNFFTPSNMSDECQSHFIVLFCMQGGQWVNCHHCTTLLYIPNASLCSAMAWLSAVLLVASAVSRALLSASMMCLVHLVHLQLAIVAHSPKCVKAIIWVSWTSSMSSNTLSMVKNCATCLARKLIWCPFVWSGYICMTSVATSICHMVWCASKGQLVGAYVTPWTCLTVLSHSCCFATSLGKCTTTHTPSTPGQPPTTYVYNYMWC